LQLAPGWDSGWGKHTASGVMGASTEGQQLS
jgi:hypothetical protein